MFNKQLKHSFNNFVIKFFLILPLIVFCLLCGIYNYLYLPYDFYNSPIVSNYFTITNKIATEMPGDRTKQSYIEYDIIINPLNSGDKKIEVPLYAYNKLKIGEKLKVNYQIGKDKKINIVSFEK